MRQLPIGAIVMVLGIAVIVGSILIAQGALRMPAAPEREVPEGDPEAGRQALIGYGCGACHAIPGIREARGRVAPPLSGVAERSYLAGRIPNTTQNMILWIQNPQDLIPGTAMPDLGVTERDARDMAAYLFRLR